MNGETIYLDYAAATPMDRRVVDAMMPFFSDAFYNPSSPYVAAIEVRRSYEAAKTTIAQAIGAQADELVMTAGATESINLAFGVAKDAHVVVPAIEHHAVLAAARGAKATSFVPVKNGGIVSPNEIARAIRDDTVLVSVALANNELGTIQPIREIAAIIRSVRDERLRNGDATPIYLHSDASQGFGQLDIHVARLGVDMLTLNAAKIYGPKQTGLLWTSRHVALKPQIVGGGQERGLRSGTENVAGTVGFARAVELAVKYRKLESDRLRTLRDALQKSLMDAFPEAVISGNVKHRLAGHLHISFPGIDAERILFALEARGVFLATGSACAANKGTRSHVLTAIGLDDSVADGSLRMTLGKDTSEASIKRASEQIIEVLTVEYERTRRV